MQIVIYLASGIVEDVYAHDDGKPTVEYVTLDADENMMDEPTCATMPTLRANGEESSLSGVDVHVGAAFPAIGGKLAGTVARTAFSLSAEYYADVTADEADDDDDDDN